MNNRSKIEDTMEAGGIKGASFATINFEGEIIPNPVGTIVDNGLQVSVTENTLFECASLSKPVFAYLVLKLIEANKNHAAEDGLGKFKIDFDLHTPLYTIFMGKDKNILKGENNPFLKQFKNQEQAKQLTAAMVLSHTTGLPIKAEPPFQFQFKPGTRYAYSGPGIECLQLAIDELTGTNLEVLAKKHVFDSLHMTKSTYGAEVSKLSAANSLQTTAEEYAKFIIAWINDDKLNDIHNAFKPIEPADSMMNDYFPEKDAVGRLVEKIDTTDPDRNLVAWGLGIGLVKNEKGQVIGAYHTGDSGNEIAWRAGFGAIIDPDTHHCIAASVYLTQSPNGHILAEVVLPDILKPALDYFFPTYGFARNSKELDGTSFYGLNPNILNEGLKKAAIDTRESKTKLNKNSSVFFSESSNLDPSKNQTNTDIKPSNSSKPTRK
jgi:CubicO group peptidase (beta-lactamase class C family)